VDETLMPQMPNAPFREVLDWLVDQMDRLDEHLETLLQDAAQGTVEEAVIVERRTAIADAHEWLAEQLAAALSARGVQSAA
jgi:hypothetical protein